MPPIQFVQFLYALLSVLEAKAIGFSSPLGIM